MVLLTKKRISRRAVLRGAGASIALPLLDAMIPAGVALADTVVKPRTRMGVFLLSARRVHGQVDRDQFMDAGRRGAQLRGFAGAEAAREIPRSDDGCVGVAQSRPGRQGRRRP